MGPKCVRQVYEFSNGSDGCGRPKIGEFVLKRVMQICRMQWLVNRFKGKAIVADVIERKG